MFDENDRGLDVGIMNGSVKIVQVEEERRGDMLALVSSIVHMSGIRAQAENLDRNGGDVRRRFRLLLPQKGCRISDVERLIQILRGSKLKVSRYIEPSRPH